MHNELVIEMSALSLHYKVRVAVTKIFSDAKIRDALAAPRDSRVFLEQFSRHFKSFTTSKERYVEVVTMSSTWYYSRCFFVRIRRSAARIS